MAFRWPCIDRRRKGAVSVSARCSRSLVLLAALLSACASIEPQDKPSLDTAIPVPPPRPAAIVERLSPEHARMIALFDGEYKFPPAESYLNEILAKLDKADETGSEPYRVTILNSPIVNAFALPPGHVYVTRGLLTLANDAAEVAAVLAHEIAHITAKHALQREEEKKKAAVISEAANVIQSKEKSEEVETLAQRSIASFSRQQELEADQIGIRMCARAGFDPYGAARFLNTLDRSTSLRSSLLRQYAGNSQPDMLATHPSTPDRIAQAINAARQIGAPGIGKTDRSGYLAAIDGMTFGDDPAEGLIQGRQFLHVRLGFGFLAPESFMLENTTQALLGVKTGGNEALRIDSVSVPMTTQLTAYMSSGWIDGLNEASIGSTEVNGLPAATATAKAGEWSFFLAVIRFDANRVYRLIFAARILNDEAKSRFLASIQTFHRVSAEEVKALRPYRIAILTARPGETSESLAARMAVPDRPLDTFLLINGLAPGDPLQASERYKTVVQ